MQAQQQKLYHMGLRKPVAKSTLSYANESRDWRIYAEFAQKLILEARQLYAKKSFSTEKGSPGYPNPLDIVVVFVNPDFRGVGPSYSYL